MQSSHTDHSGTLRSRDAKTCLPLTHKIRLKWVNALVDPKAEYVAKTSAPVLLVRPSCLTLILQILSLWVCVWMFFNSSICMQYFIRDVENRSLA